MSHHFYFFMIDKNLTLPLTLYKHKYDIIVIL